MLSTIVAGAKRHRIEPWAYVRDLLLRLHADDLRLEELLPDAVENAVEIFRANPGLGAATCDGYITDAAGRETGTFVAGAFDLVDYLFGRYCPFWPGTFFRRQALIDIGLEYHDWALEAFEFEVWCRLGAQHHVKSFPVLSTGLFTASILQPRSVTLGVYRYSMLSIGLD